MELSLKTKYLRSVNADRRGLRNGGAAARYARTGGAAQELEKRVELRTLR